MLFSCTNVMFNEPGQTVTENKRSSVIMLLAHTYSVFCNGYFWSGSKIYDNFRD